MLCYSLGKFICERLWMKWETTWTSLKASPLLRRKKMLQILNTQFNFHIFLVQSGKSVVLCPKMGEWASHPAFIKKKKKKLSPIRDAFLNLSYVTKSPILRQPLPRAACRPPRLLSLRRESPSWNGPLLAGRTRRTAGDSRTKPPRPANDMYTD